MRLMEVWERLHEIKGMSFAEVEEWLRKNDEEFDDDFEVEDLEDADEDEEVYGYVGGYWSDFTPVIVFVNGVVTKWFRTGAWE